VQFADVAGKQNQSILNRDVIGVEQVHRFSLTSGGTLPFGTPQLTTEPQNIVELGLIPKRTGNGFDPGFLAQLVRQPQFQHGDFCLQCQESIFNAFLGKHRQTPQVIVSHFVDLLHCIGF
jgi:hypothetical protein